jgi:MoxR-like ATPase
LNQVNTNNLKQQLDKCSYIADENLITTLQMMQQLERPLLIEGEAGVGKTAIAQALAEANSTRLIRLQCYEGIDSSASVYEWNYSKQLLWIKLNENQSTNASELQTEIFSRDFLLERPLLAAIQEDKSPVLLIDEIDRSDESFEAFLLEVLSEFQISIPEFGTIKASSIPHVILTSNGTRELSDALRRRCLYHYLDFPDFERELAIVMQKIPDANENFMRQVVTFIQQTRNSDIRKRPGVAETLDWATTLIGFGITDLNNAFEDILKTRGCFLKTEEDTRKFDRKTVAKLFEAIT